mmetsp:Transcript_88441/g.255084  ORF Transcript_88441/g.255084 Transcript_88441/m.255084 type:complete len:232 (+) Transcript_88441:700-1395(+)
MLGQLAALQHPLRRTLEDDADIAFLARLGVDSQHPLVGAVEGHLEHQRRGGLGVADVRVQQLLAGDDDGHLGRRTREMSVDGLLSRAVQQAALRQAGHLGGDRALLQWLDADALTARHDEVRDGHVAGGQSSCLVAAQNAHATERLHGIDPPYQHVAAGHLLGGDHETECHGRHQAFGNLCEKCRRRAGQDVAQGLVGAGKQQADEEGEEADDGRDDGDQVHKVLDLNLKG